LSYFLILSVGNAVLSAVLIGLLVAYFLWTRR